jgi:hypothetical protein
MGMHGCGIRVSQVNGRVGEHPTNPRKGDIHIRVLTGTNGAGGHPPYKFLAKQRALLEHWLRRMRQIRDRQIGNRLLQFIYVDRVGLRSQKQFRFSGRTLQQSRQFTVCHPLTLGLVPFWGQLA